MKRNTAPIACQHSPLCAQFAPSMSSLSLSEKSTRSGMSSSVSDSCQARHIGDYSPTTATPNVQWTEPMSPQHGHQLMVSHSCKRRHLENRVLCYKRDSGAEDDRRKFVRAHCRHLQRRAPPLQASSYSSSSSNSSRHHELQ